jgi:hypothetical protein
VSIFTSACIANDVALVYSYAADSYQQYDDGIFGDHNKLSKFGKGNNDIFGCPQAI